MKQWMMAAALAWSAMCVSAQHDMSVDFETRVNGPNSDFTMTLTMSPADINISGFSIRVYYDSSQVDFIAVEDNTGQPSAGVFYTFGPPESTNAFPNVNTSRAVILTTSYADLVTPTTLARLRFKSKPAYSDPDNRVWVYMGGHTSAPGLMVYEPTSEEGYIVIPTTYNNRSTPVPVTLSGFSLE